MPEPGALHGTLLGIDYGLRRIGVAVGQTTTRTCSALATIAHSSEPDWQAIAGLVTEWRPAGFVIGLPLDAQGAETRMSALARGFGREMQRRFNVPVFFIDERLTSSEAGARFVQARTQGRARRKDALKLDAVAAQIILENWLQSLPAGAPG